MEVLPGPVDTAVQGETRLAPGIDRMLGRMPLGDTATMASRIITGLERNRRRVIYSRLATIAYLLPALASRGRRDQPLRPGAVGGEAGARLRVGSTPPRPYRSGA
jgi:hypothetical protein